MMHHLEFNTTELFNA